MNGMQLGIYLSYAAAPGSNPGEPSNLYNPNPNRKSAYSITAELGAFANGRGAVQAAYRHGNNGGTQYETDNATSLGISYMPSHNVQLSLLHTTFGGNAYSSDNSTPPALEGASGSGSRLTTFNLGLGF
jgi:hypothetical protein